MIAFPALGQYGRFGNQLWQIAATIGIANHFNTTYLLPHWEYEGWFKNVHCSYMTGVEFPFSYYEPDPYFNWPNIIPLFNTSIYGYFQSYKYFEDCKDDIRKAFDFGADPNFSLNKVAIHVRRGDYLNLSYIHPVLSMEYYKEAVSLFPPDTEYAIFSDDYKWCKENFIGDQFHFYDHIYLKDPTVIEWQVMSQCKSNIVANSSYSWWAAWLNKTPDKVVVAPKTWVINEIRDDRVPKDWILV